MYAAFLMDLFIGGSQDLARKGLATVRSLLESGILLRTPKLDLALNGRAMLVEGDAKGAAALWRIHAGEYGPPINAIAFVRAGEDDLAGKHYRIFVQKFSIVPRMHHVRLARLRRG